MENLPEFRPFDKIYRWERPWIITEKIDGSCYSFKYTFDGDGHKGNS